MYTIMDKPFYVARAAGSFGADLVALRDKTIENAYKRGLILLGAGESAIRFIPPLIINEKQIDEAIDILDDSIKASL